MLISTIAALALLAAAPASTATPETAAVEASAAAKPASAQAKPEMRRVCHKVEVQNSRAPKKSCRMAPVSSGAAEVE